MNEAGLIVEGLIVEGLSVAFGSGDTRRDVVRDVSFTLAPGKVVALVGESGSGKSVTARALMGLAGEGATVSARRLSSAGRDLRALSDRQWRMIRGREIGLVMQDALVSLDPVRPIGQEILEALSVHGWGTAASKRRRVVDLLELVGIPDPALRVHQRAGQLSGGLRQRALIATALALDPALVIADEPTTALDATVQAQILDVFEAIKGRGGGLLLISHDFSVVGRLADEILVMRHGEVVEQGSREQVLERPCHPYTQVLLRAVPGSHPRGTRLSTGAAPLLPKRAADDRVVLRASGLSKTFEQPDGRRRLVVSDVSFMLRAGETLGIVGESGSGKTTTGRIVLGLSEPDAGCVTFDGHPWAGAGAERVRESRRRRLRPGLGVIYQDALSSFDPRWRVAEILGDALAAANVPRRQHRDRIADLLDKVRLPADAARRLPLHLSGGQRQRIAIARAIASNPKVIVCDEPVSALDVSVQAQVLDLLADLQAELGLACLFISHDLGVIRHVADRVLVMTDGRVVEQGPVEQVFDNPRHPFTRRLLAASRLGMPGAGRIAA